MAEPEPIPNHPEVIRSRIIDPYAHPPECKCQRICGGDQ